MKILGSSAFVTGGANGIGANLSEKLLKAGANVYMADINGEQGRVLETKFRLKYGEDKATFLKCDVTNEEQFSEAFNSAVGIAGHIDLMINNAGIMHENKWKSTVDVNLNGVILGTNMAVAHMRKDKGGKGGVIINTGSISEMGIRFSCVHPVAADTQISRFVSEDQTVYHDEINKRLNSLHLLPVDKVSDAFMKVIENDDSTITNLHVTTEDSHSIKLDVIHLKNQILHLMDTGHIHIFVMKISGSKAFVSGGANGIGAGICETLLKYGSEVYIADINEEQGKVLEKKFRSLYGADKSTFVKCDVSNEQQFTDAFNKVVTLTGHIDLMINNAGILNERNWKLTMDVNLGGVIVGTNLAIAHMRKDKGGKGGVIINTGSAAALFPRFAVPVYSATKAGIVQFTSSLASNPYLDEMGIRVSTVNPEGTVTEMINSQKEENNVYYKHFEERLTTVNLLTVDQVVEAFVKIIDDDDTNGTHLFVTTEGIKRVKQQIVLQ